MNVANAHARGESIVDVDANDRYALDRPAALVPPLNNAACRWSLATSHSARPATTSSALVVRSSRVTGY